MYSTNNPGSASAKARANAQLWAAAPELLEALTFIRDSQMYASDFAGAIEFEKARTAIAKATGQEVTQ